MANWAIEEKKKIWNKGQIVPGYDPLCGVRSCLVLLSNKED